MAVFQFQAADADMDRWKRDADRRSMSFAAYIRQLLDEAGARLQAPAVQPLDPTPMQPRTLPPTQVPSAPSGKRSFAPDPK
jgi:hypothetical protein